MRLAEHRNAFAEQNRDQRHDDLIEYTSDQKVARDGAPAHQPNVLARFAAKLSDQLCWIAGNILYSVALACRLAAGEDVVLRARMSAHAVRQGEVVGGATHDHRVD